MQFLWSHALHSQPLPRSMRLTTAPGAYSPVTSDFDQLRLKILKQKKMAVRSGWAQNIAFTSTEGRFSQHTGEFWWFYFLQHGTSTFATRSVSSTYACTSSICTFSLYVYFLLNKCQCYAQHAIMCTFVLSYTQASVIWTDPQRMRTIRRRELQTTCLSPTHEVVPLGPRKR